MLQIKDRSEKLRKAKARMPMNGIAFKKLLIERAQQNVVSGAQQRRLDWLKEQSED